MSTIKPRSSSILHGLPSEQREQLNEWLFEENCSYTETAERCRDKFLVAVSASSVMRYYQREAAAWRAEQMVANGNDARLINEASKERREETYQATLNLTEHLAYEKLLDKDVKPGTVVQLMKVQIAARKEAHEAERTRLEQERLRLEAEQVRVKVEHLEIFRARFEFDAAAECLEHQMEVNEILADKTKNNGEKIAAAREKLFGGNLPP